MNNHVIPFFVADRPVSLSILKGVLLKYPFIKVGVITHAFTSRNLWRIFNEFPFEPPLLYEDEQLEKNETLLAECLIKMTDSGIFGKNGCTIDYDELFSRYDRMGTHFGIMIDVFRDGNATLKSADQALRVYNKNRKKHSFKLVAVAQGNHLEEYLECYRKLRKDFEFIAVGGLLKKRENTARYVHVRDENLLYDVLEAIRKEFNPKWLFALGCYHPLRHKKFEQLGVWGSDYKGWIFQYKQKTHIVKKISSQLALVESETEPNNRLSRIISKIDGVESHLAKEESKWRGTREKMLKKYHFTRIKKLRSESENLYQTLMREIELLAKRNHLPTFYKEKLKHLSDIIARDEQELRFAQVREYIEKNVYAQLQ